MRRFLPILILLTSGLAFGQGVRIDPFPSSTVTRTPLPGNLYPAMLAIPGSLVSVCNYPANGSPCTNLATTYTDASLATACPSNAQVVLQGSATCQSTADLAGNFGFWVSAGGNYVYQITLPGSSQTYGPFAFTAATAGCPTTGCHFTGDITAPHVTATASATTPQLNNVHYANEWCTTPGTLDDTCFTNAIADITANGPLGFANRRMGVILVPPGIYTFQHTVVLPLGDNLSIIGTAQDGVWGSVIQSQTTPIDLFQVNSDNTEIKELVFWGGRNAINLGSPSQGLFDTHINWNWFILNAIAIHIANGSGLDLSHNTCDSGNAYCIASSAAAGDIQALAIVASDLRCYGQQYAISILGDGTGSFGSDYFSGIFDHDIASEAVDLENVANITVEGNFNNNQGKDAYVFNSKAVTLGSLQVENTGSTSVFILNSTDTHLTNSNFLNSALGVTPGTVPMISVQGSTGTLVQGNSSTVLAPGTGSASYGLMVDGTSVGTRILSNSFNAQTVAPYNVLDTTANVDILGMTTVINEAGGVVATMGQDQTANPKNIVISTDPTNNAVSIEGVQQGIGWNQTLNLNPHAGAPVVVGGPFSAQQVIVGGATWRSFAGTPVGNCAIGDFATNTTATSASTVFYACYPANTYNPVSIP